MLDRSETEWPSVPKMESISKLSIAIQKLISLKLDRVTVILDILSLPVRCGGSIVPDFNPKFLILLSAVTVLDHRVLAQRSKKQNTVIV